jgi:dephospho-CoA kinase
VTVTTPAPDVASPHVAPFLAPPLVVALTGNIASGKSTVAAHFVAHGAALLDADRAAHEAVAPGTPALAAIAARFGAGVLQPDGALDRAAMGRLVFRDPEARRALEAIVHPAVSRTRRAMLAAARASGAAVIVCDIPLVFEARLAPEFARIVLVDAPVPARLARLVGDRGMTEGDARARIDAQLAPALKRPRVDLVIENDGDRDTLARRADAAWARLVAWRAAVARDASASDHSRRSAHS